MKRLFLTLCLFGISICLQAQTYINVKYTYDNAGNRINRQIVQTFNKKGNADTVLAIVQNPENITNHIGEKTYAVFYPNPIFNTLNIDIQNITPGTPVSCKITDLFGRTLYEQIANDKSLKIDLTSIASGVYLITLKFNNTEIIHKINKFHQ